MDMDQIVAIAGPVFIGTGILVLLVVVLRPGSAPQRAQVPIRLADPDDDVHPGLGELPVRRLPVGAEQVLAGLLEIEPHPRNNNVITATRPEPSSAAMPEGDPDTGVIRILQRSEIRRPVPPASVEHHPARNDDRVIFGRRPA